MQNALKPSGEKATGLLRGRFHATRVQLTVIYTVILALILFISSAVLYSSFSNRLHRRFEHSPPRAPAVFQDGTIPPRPEDVLADLLSSLVAVNGALLVIAGVLSYVLAGLTLEPIQAAYERQRRFLGDASHELRTPLAILQTDLENELNAPQTDAQSYARAESHLEEVQRMGQLVSDLLMLSRLDEQANTQHVLEMVNMLEIVQKAVDRMQGIAERQQVQLSVDFSSTDSMSVRANHELLLQALTNLLKNAIFYNTAGGNVNVTLTKDKNRVKLTIIDTGIGISPDDQKKIFERFYRVDKSRSRQTGGSGLGLSITQSIIRRFGGSVEIQSALGAGTSVTLLLPLA